MATVALQQISLCRALDIGAHGVMVPMIETTLAPLGGGRK